MPIESAESTRLAKAAMTRRFYTRSVVKGEITLPAVPSMIDEYVTMCAGLLRVWAESFPTKNLLIFARCSRVSWQRRTRPPSVRPSSSHTTPPWARPCTTKSEPNGGRWRRNTRTGSPPVSRRSSVPNQTHVCGRWPTKQPILRRIGCSKLAPEPGVTPWRWHGADTRSTWWR